METNSQKLSKTQRHAVNETEKKFNSITKEKEEKK